MRQRHLDLGVVVLAARRAARPAAGASRCGVRPAVAGAALRRALVRQRVAAPRRARRRPPAARRRPATNTASKAVTCVLVGHEHGAGRPVQAAARETGRTSVSARANVGRPRGRDRHARVVQAPAERSDERRQVELDRLDPERTGSVTAAHELLEAGRADHLLVLAVLQHRARACGRPPRRRAARRRAGSSAASQSIASAIPGGFCTSLSRMRETAFATCTASVSDAPFTRRRTISTSRCGRRVGDPVVEAAALDRVVQVARAVRGEHDDRRVRRADRAELGDRHAGLRRAARAGTPRSRRRRGRSRRSAGPPAAGPGARARAAAAGGSGSRGRTAPPRAARARSTSARRMLEQLARVVPLVERLGRVDALVALQADQRRVEHGASALAASVLPTPASPSSSSGCGRRRLRNIDVARPSSTR